MNKTYLNSVLTIIAVLLALNVWLGVHSGPSVSASLHSEALAQGSANAGQQRAEMIKELKGLKSTVESISKKLSDGSVKVKVEGDINND